VGSRTDLVLRDRQIILGRQYKAPRLQPDCRRSVRRARAPMATDLSVSDGSAAPPGMGGPWTGMVSGRLPSCAAWTRGGVRRACAPEDGKVTVP